MRDEHIAQDMVQEAYLRALKYYDSLRGSGMRPCLLGIVRNTCYTWLQSNKRGEEAVEFDEECESVLMRWAGMWHLRTLRNSLHCGHSHEAQEFGRKTLQWMRLSFY